MKQTNNYIIKIYLIILFILSQTFTWELISHFISETSGFYKTYPAFQIMFAYIYILSCVFFTRDNEHFMAIMEKPAIYKFFDVILNASAIIIEFVMRACIIIPKLFSSSSNSPKEIQPQKEEAFSNVQKYKEYPIQARCILPIGVIIIFSIPLFQFGEETFLHYYSQTMNLLAAILGFYFILCNVEVPNPPSSDDGTTDLPD